MRLEDLHQCTMAAGRRIRNINSVGFELQLPLECWQTAVASVSCGILRINGVPMLSDRPDGTCTRVNVTRFGGACSGVGYVATLGASIAGELTGVGWAVGL